MSSLIRVLCVDDHQVVIEGIASLINRQRDMRVVAAAPTAELGIKLFREHRPDVTLMDLQLPGMSGVEAIRAVRREEPKSRIIVLTIYQGDEDMYRALQAGAATYVLKDTLTSDLVRVIRQVHAGECPIPPVVQDGLARRAGYSQLTDRECRVLSLIANGMRNKEIAAALNIAEETTRVHVKHILQKLQVNDRTAAVSLALRRGLIHIP
jgi:two-component system NarL family response regulator